jgi:hypothetical protein
MTRAPRAGAQAAGGRFRSGVGSERTPRPGTGTLLRTRIRRCRAHSTASVCVIDITPAFTAAE